MQQREVGSNKDSYKGVFKLCNPFRTCLHALVKLQLSTAEGQSFVFRESLNTQISQFHFSILSIYNFLKIGLLKRGNKL